MKNFIIPTVGMGATLILWSDRLPYTITKVEGSVDFNGVKIPRVLHATQDKAEIINGQSILENPEYKYTTDNNAEIELFVWNNTTKRYRLGNRRQEWDETLNDFKYVYNGRTSKNNTRLLVGERYKYFDPYF